MKKLRLTITVGIGFYIFLTEQIAGYMRILQLLAEVVQLREELFMTLVCHGTVTSVKYFLQFGIIEFQKLVERQPATCDKGELIVYRLLVDTQL